MLLRRGRSVALQPQPARALALLLERAGEVVTREELRAHLWGEETYLDTDQGINFAVRKIRSALGDDSASSRFIATVPRIGYRFVAPVERLEVADCPTTGPFGSSPPKWRSSVAMLSAAALVALAIGLLGLRQRDPVRLAGENSKIAGAPGGATLEDAASANASYLRGRYLISLPQAESIERGVEALEQAIVEEPELAVAHAALGSGLLKLGAKRPALPIAVRVERAARQAIELDDELAEGHFVLATAKFYFQMDWVAAEREFTRALELSPEAATILHAYGLYLASVGRFDEAITLIHRAINLDPARIYVGSDLAQVYFWAGRYAEAMTQARENLALDGSDSASHACLVASLLQRGERQAALEHWNAMFEALSLPPVVSLHEAVEGSIRYLSAREVEGRRFDVQLAALYLQQGKDDLAMQRLQVGCRERTQWLVPFIAVDPRFDPLRLRPEYRALDCRAPLAVG